MLAMLEGPIQRHIHVFAYSRHDAACSGEHERREEGWIAPGEQVVQRRGEGVFVRASVRETLILFGRRVASRADSRAAGHYRGPGYAEIDQGNSTVRPEDGVLRLHVAED